MTPSHPALTNEMGLENAGYPAFLIEHACDCSRDGLSGFHWHQARAAVWLTQTAVQHRSDGPSKVEFDRSAHCAHDDYSLCEHCILGAERWTDPHGKLHADGKPALVTYWPSGAVNTEEWHRHGIVHRTDGPARVRYADRPASTVVVEDWKYEGELTYRARVELHQRVSDRVVWRNSMAWDRIVETMRAESPLSKTTPADHIPTDVVREALAAHPN